ncbi:calcium-binding protein [Roseibium algicola]|uniref:calcium-binding protein n=1 Tax=Roseibium algicola TaxID=2857014 RepID=UPI003458417B
MAIVFRGHKNDFIQTANRNDIIFGGGGNDTINSEGGDDLIYAGRGDDIINAGSGDDLVFGGAGNDLITGGGGADVIFAGRGNDTAVFVAADNTDNESRGDYYDGGSGCDTLRIELTSDMWSQDAAKADMFAFLEHLKTFGSVEEFRFSSVNLCVKRFEKLEVFVDGQKVDLFVTDPDDGPLVIDRSSSTEDETITTIGDGDTDIRTGSGNDTITAGNGNNVIDAGDGNNKVTTGTGADIITTGSGDDVIDSGDGNDTIYIGDGDDVVRAGGGNDTIIAGNGGGVDLIDAGSGNDLVTYPSDVDGISVDLNEIDRSLMALGNGMTVGDLLSQNGYAANTLVAIAQGISIDSDVLISVENITGGGGNDTIMGNELANRIIGEGGDDTLFGNDGDDDLRGGSGNDTLNGGGGDDLLEGGTGLDVLDGGGGHDTIILRGPDTDYSITNNGDGSYTLTDNGGNGDGVDIISNIERLVFSNVTQDFWELVPTNFVYGTPGDDKPLNGTPAFDDIQGYAGDDDIFGYSGEDWITGGQGNDYIDAGSGTTDDDNFLWDTIAYDREVDEGGFQGVTVNLALQTATDTFGNTDTLIEFERVMATNFADSITGSDADEGFDPHGGDDFIDGGAGYDQLMYHLSYTLGGTGGIIVTFDDSTANTGDGTAIDPFGDTDTFTNIEGIRGTANADQVYGGQGHQTLRGYDGADIFDGGGGYDRADYSQDSAYGGTAGIHVDLENTDASGFGLVIDGFGSQDRLWNVEWIRGTGSADEMWGDANANEFEGRAGDDELHGRAGDDLLFGGLGNDALHGDDGLDTLEGDNGDDVLMGGADDDHLDGGSGEDTLNGGTGNDFMVGGLDADRFHFSAGSGNDTIGDFELGVDGLVLEGGMTIASLSEVNVGGDASLDTIVDFSSGDQVVLLDVNGVADPSQLQIV